MTKEALKSYPIKGGKVGRARLAVLSGVLSSVGCYQLEGEGVQLFDRIEGDYFAILGLSLIPLLDVLRRQGAVAL